MAEFSKRMIVIPFATFRCRYSLKRFIMPRIVDKDGSLVPYPDIRAIFSRQDMEDEFGPPNSEGPLAKAVQDALDSRIPIRPPSSRSLS